MTATDTRPVLDCGHPDTGHLWHTTPNGHTVCARCCHECREEET